MNLSLRIFADPQNAIKFIQFTLPFWSVFVASTKLVLFLMSKPSASQQIAHERVQNMTYYTNMCSQEAMKRGRGTCGTFQSFKLMYHAHTTFMDIYANPVNQVVLYRG